MWQKTTGLFDVTMGSYDGAELCELVGLYILHIMSQEFPEIDFGLYRDDGLGAMQIIPKPALERTKKKLHATFKKHFGLTITCEGEKNSVNHLDVNFNMRNETYAPYRKPNDNPLYIHRESNHPPHIAKQLPKSVSTRLNTISCNREIFNDTKEVYEKALHESNLCSTLKFEEKTKEKQQKKPRKRKQIWFTPPYNVALKTNIGKEFLKLIDKHFPVNHPLHPIFNRRTIKVSYSTSESLAQIIQNHNRKVLSKQKESNDKMCNCRDKKECPTDNKCCTESVIYRAEVTEKKAEYIGMTTTSFKLRYSNHKKSFKHEQYKNETTLSSFIWDKKLNPNPKIKWQIIKKCEKYQPGQKACRICTSEKYFIIKGLLNAHNINKKTDIASQCVHRRDATLKFYNSGIT